MALINLSFASSSRFSSGASTGFLVGAALILASVIWLFIEARNSQFVTNTNEAKKNRRVMIASVMAVSGIILILVLGFFMFIM
jgi:amino acid transporter